MINIKAILYGWLTFSIEDFSFRASYLTEPIEDINKALDYLAGEEIETYHNPQQVYLDGEGDDLYLTIWKSFNEDIVIIWEAYYENSIMGIFTFDFDEFYKEWKMLTGRVKDDYENNFLFKEDDFKYVIGENDVEN